MGSLGASCFYTLSPQTRDIEKAAWDDERFGMVCTRSENLANWKAAILELCSNSGICTYEDVQSAQNLGSRVSHFQARSSLIRRYMK